MTVSTLPTLPVAPHSILRPATFSPESDAFFAALPAFRDAFNANVPGIQAIADLAPLVSAAANYKGPWASLVGALAIPASTTHTGKAWLLSESVADVTAHVPGVSSKWILMTPPQTVELISTTNAIAAANVEWSNFEALAATYDNLRLVASGVVGSAATSTLTGQIRQNNAWQTGGWSVADLPSTSATATISLTNQLKNTVASAIALDLNVYQLDAAAANSVFFVLRGDSGSVCFGRALTPVAPTTPIQGLRIYASTGTLTGTFRLYGVRKS